MFQGRFTRKAAAEVNGLGVPDLSDLCNKSLLERYEDGSFGIPALVREFAGEMVNEIMETSRQEELRQRHCTFFLNLLSHSSSELVTGDRKRAAGELAMFLHDMLEAWTFAVRRNLHGLLARACVPLRTLLGIRNMYREGMQLMEESIAGLGEPSGREALELKGWLLSSLGWFCSFCGSAAQSIGYLEEAVGTFRSAGSDHGLADALNVLGNVLYVSGDSERAFAAYEESLGIRRGLSDGPGVAAVLNNLGNLSCQKTEYEQARAYYQESLRLQRISGNQHGISSILSNLAIVSIALDDLKDAGLMLGEALELEMNIGDRFNSAIVQGIMCELHLKTGNLEEVEKLCRDNLETYESAGNAWGMAESFSTLARLHILRGNLRDSAEAILNAINMISGRDWDPLALKILGVSAELLAEEGKEDEASEIAMFVSGHGSCPPELRAEMGKLLHRSGLGTADECPPPDGDLDRMLVCAAGKLSPLLR
jgi:tetratricopeptide (TPR) repeat protein